MGLVSMIDVRLVLAHGLWILGAATGLAAFSYYDWLARAQGRPRREVMRAERGWTLGVAGGVLLAASGCLLMESATWWERGIWLVVWMGAARQLWSKL